jgi:hypothetical protein
MITQEMSVKKTTLNDFEKIYPLLLAFNSPYSRDDWRRIFDYQWEGAQDHVGYHLENHGEVVGFMGLIFSCRYKNNRRYLFCNISSLIVKPEYRSSTLLLLRKLTGYQNTIFTGLGPIDESYRLMILLGFTSFESQYKIIPTINGLFLNIRQMVVDESNNLVNKLDSENKRIFLDHQNLQCKSILIEKNGKSVLLIYSTDVQKHYCISVTKIHLRYISDLVFFNKEMRAILTIFKKKFGIFSAIYMDKRWVSCNAGILAFNRKIDPPKIRSKIFLDEIDVDAIYSEVLLL